MGRSSEIESGKKISKAYHQVSKGINEQSGDGPGRRPRKAWKYDDTFEGVLNRTHMRVREMHARRALPTRTWVRTQLHKHCTLGGVKKCQVGAMQEACGVMGGETQDDRGKVVGGEMREVSI